MENRLMLRESESAQISLEQDSGLPEIAWDYFSQDDGADFRNFFSQTSKLFIESENSKLTSCLQKFISGFQFKKPCISKSAFKKHALQTLTRCFENSFNSIFSSQIFEENQSSSFEHLAFSFSGAYLDFAFKTLGLLWGTFLEDRSPSMTDNKEMIDSIMTDKSTKRVWTANEADELLVMMKTHYPENVPSTSIDSFCEKHRRTRAAVVNKMQKMKKKGEIYLLKSNIGMRDRSSKNSLAALEEQMVLIVKRSKGITFDKLLKEMDMERFGQEGAQKVESHLYSLLSKGALKSRDIIYVDKNMEGPPPSSNLLQVVYTSLQKAGGQMKLSDVSRTLVRTFDCLDINQPNFESDLIEYLTNSNSFFIRSLREFFVS